MADLREINAEKFKESLISTFGESDKVNFLCEELRLSPDQKNPFFYGAILDYIESNPQKINDIVDSQNNVNFGVINGVVQQAKEKFAKNQDPKETQESKEKTSFEDYNLEEVKAEFDKIDFDNLGIDDFKFIANNYDFFMRNSTDRQFQQTMEKIQTLLGTDDRYMIVASIARKSARGERLTEDEQNFMQELPDDYAANIGWDKKNGSFNSEHFKAIEKERLSVLEKISEMINEGEKITEDVLNAVIKSFPALSGIPGIIDTDQVLKSIQEGKFEDILNNAKEDSKAVSYKQDESTQDDIEALSIADMEKTIGARLELDKDIGLDFMTDLESMIGSALKEYSVAENSQVEQQGPVEISEILSMQVDFEQYFAEAIATSIDFAEISQEKSDMEEIRQEAGEQRTDIPEQTMEEQDTLEFDEPAEEPRDELPEEYEIPTFEEKKTGIAGIFAAIANSRVGQAVKKLFKPKQEQKKLNAAVNQRTEDGVKITEYESNGSLMPTTIQARNFFRNFAINTVEAVTNFANNISNAVRGDNKEESIVNRPTIIKSEQVQEQSEQQATLEQNQQKAETYLDNNQWAVSQETLNKVDKNMPNKSQVQNRDTKDDGSR